MYIPFIVSIPHPTGSTGTPSSFIKRSGNIPVNEKCEYYATFMKKVSRKGADSMFFLSYLLVIILLYTAAWAYNRQVQRVSGSDNNTDAEGEMEESERDGDGDSDDQERQAGKQYAALVISTICFLTSSFVTVMCVYAIMCIWFCHHEDLISLYWGFWLLGVIGSDIAMLGIMVNEIHILFGTPRPIYALALATPIPVLVGCINFVHQGGKMMNRRKKDDDDDLVRISSARDRDEERARDRDRLRVKELDQARIVPFRLPGDFEVRWREVRHLPEGAVRVHIDHGGGGAGSKKNKET